MTPPNLHLKDLYNNTVEFLSHHSPTFTFGNLGSERTRPSEARARRSLPDLVSGAPPPRVSNELEVTERPQSALSTPHRSTAATSVTAENQLIRDLNFMRTHLAGSQMDVRRLQERCHSLERSLQEAKDLLKARDTEIERLRTEKERERTSVDRRRSQDDDRGPWSTSHSERRGSQTHDGRVEQVRRTGRKSSSNAENRASPLSIPQLDEDRAQLRSLECFLTKTDGWSGAQVIQAVQDLNTEILQFAAAATDHFTYSANLRASASSQAAQDVAYRLGPHMAHILSTTDHAQDPTFVQLALQGCISACLARPLSSFCMGLNGHDVLSQLYDHLSFAEPQPTSSRWRALTHQYLHALYPDLEKDSLHEVTGTLLGWSADVLLLAGASSPDVTHSPQESLRTCFGARAQRIAKAVYKLSTATREDIMSTNFEIYAIEHGGTFDARRMSDAFHDHGPSNGYILCTTELGLCCSTKRVSSGPGSQSPTTIESRVLLHPKVVLESAIEALDRS